MLIAVKRGGRIAKVSRTVANEVALWHDRVEALGTLAACLAAARAAWHVKRRALGNSKQLMAKYDLSAHQLTHAKYRRYKRC